MVFPQPEILRLIFFIGSDMSKMSFMEWVGLFIVLIVLLDYFENNRDWFGASKHQNKPSVSKQ
jgi:hypothetical protein